jgi:poly(hydroxyalkanoate) depolymerase family esterase
MKNKFEVSLKNSIPFAMIVIVLVLILPSSAGTFTQITTFSPNPTNLQMYVYVPTSVKARPPILVVPHACHGTAAGMQGNGSPWNAQADSYGFIIIYPGNLSSKDSCWDVHSTASLTHDGNGDPTGIVSMVKYVEQHYNGDSNRVYAAGHSSGGMMTNVLLGSYPDVFKAGAAFAGVPFGCFAAGPVDSYGWCSSCATGQITKTAAQWGDLVRAAYPGFTGIRPKMQLWHGTADAILNYVNFGEEIKEWTNVLGVSQTPTTTEANTPQSTWTRTRYANSAGQVEVEAISETGQPHNLVIRADLAIVWLGLDKATGIDNRDGASINSNGQNAEVKILRHEKSKTLGFLVSPFSRRIGLDVYDLSGKKVHTIAQQFDAKAAREFSWDGRNGSAYCPAGVYVLSVTVNGAVAESFCFTIGAN